MHPLWRGALIVAAAIGLALALIWFVRTLTWLSFVLVVLGLALWVELGSSLAGAARDANRTGLAVMSQLRARARSWSARR